MFNTRKVTLDKIVEKENSASFEVILEALKSGETESIARCITLEVGQDCLRTDNGKHAITIEEWDTCTLVLKSTKGIHLVDSQNCQAHTEITLAATDVKRVLKLTSQAGGEQPKMGPKIWGLLAAGFANGEFKTSMKPEELFTDLEEREDLWDHRGPISQARGIPAIAKFLKVTEHFDAHLAAGMNIDDISFASDD